MIRSQPWHEEALSLRALNIGSRRVARKLGHKNHYAVAWLFSSMGFAPLVSHPKPKPRVVVAKPYFNRRIALTTLCARAGISIDDMKGKNKRRAMVYKRYYVTNALREMGLSLCSIGRLINRDHTSVLHCIRRFPESVYVWHEAEEWDPRIRPVAIRAIYKRQWRARRAAMRVAAE